eukprot:TRINITY_DN9016_c2_g1_i1.p1 TRINITY_DN9016_c2_g1~~TRINITY_DN9016_c2_g1_i1.p1  ORF type:complete len:389 (+),score=48.78 TRINITY_DN9016_c2_g1_i1:72-1169(+)
MDEGVAYTQMDRRWTKLNRDRLLCACGIAAVVFVMPLLFIFVDSKPFLRNLPPSINVADEKTNDRPVIAILASPCDGLYNCSSYIPGSYVRWIQQAGARVVPLTISMDDAEFTHVLQHVNGALTIGGFFEMNGTAEPRVRKIWEHAMTLAEKGESFPIWGTCLGVHDLIQLASGLVYGAFLKPTETDDIALPLQFLQGASSDSLFDEDTMPGSKVFRKWFEQLPITYHHHEWGVSPDTVTGLKLLDDTFEVVATAKDRHGFEFVALLRGRKKPIFASSFHPEKTAFEWGVHHRGILKNTNIPHSREAILANLHLGTAFVDHARRSPRGFDAEPDMAKFLINEYPLVYTSNFKELIHYFEECYIFY